VSDRHTNTTPEDIAICEGYLAFLRSGNMDDFWRVAWDVGRVTRESLASMDHPVNPTPCHLPHLIGPMQHYLWILKTTHGEYVSFFESIGPLVS
jgi:alpha-glucan, water dikinase